MKKIFHLRPLSPLSEALFFVSRCSTCSAKTAAPSAWFGTRGSEVQILSPRPSFRNTDILPCYQFATGAAGRFFHLPKCLSIAVFTREHPGDIGARQTFIANRPAQKADANASARRTAKRIQCTASVPTKLSNPITEPTRNPKNTSRV
jgi:hypothetical protein